MVKGRLGELIKHSGIYGVGHVLLRMTSVILLPVYTRYLSPAEYGILAILDLTTAILGILMARGLVLAVSRYHFDSESESVRDRLWWTALVLLGAVETAFVGALFLLRNPIGELLLGSELQDAGLYTGLAVLTTGFVGFEVTLQAHLRVQKRSTELVLLSLLRGGINIALNLTLLIGFGMGVRGVLVGNLLAGAISALIFFTTFKRDRGSFSLDLSQTRDLAGYGGPLIAASLLAVAMHQADRYFLRLFRSLTEVGVYSVAYQIGQAINMMLLEPFSGIWSVAIHEVRNEDREGAPAFYAAVFNSFVYVLSLILFGAALFARPMLQILVPEEFLGAAGLIPIVCLGYFFFSLHTHFVVPALVAKRTNLTLPAHVTAVAVTVGANLLLVPAFGTKGAAWATVLTFMTFSFVGLAFYRRIERFDYAFGRCAAALLGLCLTYVGWNLALPSWEEAPLLRLTTAAGIWIVWATVLTLPMLRRLLRSRAASTAPE